jgi:histone H3/H4
MIKDAAAVVAKDAIKNYHKELAKMMEQRAGEVGAIYKKKLAAARELANLTDGVIDYSAVSKAADDAWLEQHPGAGDELAKYVQFRAEHPMSDSDDEDDTRDAIDIPEAGSMAGDNSEEEAEDLAGLELDALAAAAEAASKVDKELAEMGCEAPVNDNPEGVSAAVFFGSGSRKKIHMMSPLSDADATDDEEEEQLEQPEEEEEEPEPQAAAPAPVQAPVQASVQAPVQAPAPVLLRPAATAADILRFHGSKGPRRHRQPAYRVGISKPEIRRLARRGGVKRISAGVYPEAEASLRMFLKNVLEKAVVYTEYGKRTTVTTMDVVMGLKAVGRTLYGF